MLRLATIVSVGIAAVLAVAPAGVVAATWRSCESFSTDSVSGDPVRVTEVRVRGTSCRQARRVARGFYGQTIGSSGAGYAAGFGCAYSGASRVRCGSGAEGRGPKKVRWRERR